MTIYRAHPNHGPWHLGGEARPNRTTGQGTGQGGWGDRIARLAGGLRPGLWRAWVVAALAVPGVAALPGALPGVAAAQSAAAAPAAQGAQLPQPVGLVNDFAHVIPAANADRITQIANDVRTKSRGEIAVVTLPDIGDRDPSDVGIALIRQWKIGKVGNPGDPTRNAGAVILVVPKETNSDGRGRCWITTGSGAEGFITDADAGDICRDATPDFRQHDYGAGIALLTYETAQRFAKEYNFAVDTTLAVAAPPAASRRQGGGVSPMAMFFLFLFFYVFLEHHRAASRWEGWLSADLPAVWGRMDRWGGWRRERWWWRRVRRIWRWWRDKRRRGRLELVTGWCPCRSRSPLVHRGPIDAGTGRSSQLE